MKTPPENRSVTRTAKLDSIRSMAPSEPSPVPKPISAAAGGPIPSLDGIRAVSVGLVFCSHAGVSALIPGDLGVTTFFVLSGFLITTLMREEFARHGSLSFRAFYLRRILRLAPPLLIVVGLSVALSLAISLGSPINSQGVLSVLFYFSNYFRIVHDYWGQPPGMGVTWSLAIEEHYYLLFPPLALLLLRLRRPVYSAWILGSLCAAVLGWRTWLSLHGVSSAYLSMATDARVDSILSGCLLAMVCNPWLDPVTPSKRSRDLATSALWIAVLAGTLLWRNDAFRFTLRYTLQNTAIAGLLYLAVARAQTAPYRWLNSRPLVYIGAVSYTIYLVHFVFLLWSRTYLARLGPVVVIGVTAAATLAFAALMRQFVEKPCAVLRKRLHESLHLGRAQQQGPARSAV